MLNDNDVYYESGFKCGRARKNKDESTARFEKDWFLSAKRMEQEKDKEIAQEQFDNGYKSGRGI